MGIDIKPKFISFDMNGTLDECAPRLVENLQAPVEVVITDEQAKAYRPRLRAFDYMLDKLGVEPDEIVHVSSSPQYDHRPASDVGIKNKVYLDRGWEPDQPSLSYTRITDIAELRCSSASGVRDGEETFRFTNALRQDRSGPFRRRTGIARRKTD